MDKGLNLLRGEEFLVRYYSSESKKIVTWIPKVKIVLTKWGNGEFTRTDIERFTREYLEGIEVGTNAFISGYPVFIPICMDKDDMD